MHFSSVFTRENTSSLPVPETKFNGSEGEKLGQLVVTPEVVASKINNMKENKSPGVDGISPKILKEIVEQISMICTGYCREGPFLTAPISPMLTAHISATLFFAL